MKNSWLIVGAAVGGLMGITVGACGQSAKTTSSTSTSTSTSTGSPTSTSSGATTSSGMGGETSSSTTGTGGSTSTGMGGTGGQGKCSKVTTLHPPKADAGTGTIYCPFSSVDGGSNDYCKNSNDPAAEHCCEPSPMGTAECVPTATTCDSLGMMGQKYVDWECEDPGDCGGGSVCCSNAQASIGLGGMQNGMQCGNFAHLFDSTSCVKAATCPAGIQMCTSDGQCPGGMKCTPFGKAGNQVGGCM